MCEMVQASVPEIGSPALFGSEWRRKAEGRGGDPESRGIDRRGIGSPSTLSFKRVSWIMHRDENPERKAAAVTEKMAIGGGECGL